jgi:hypothetical protein
MCGRRGRSGTPPWRFPPGVSPPGVSPPGVSPCATQAARPMPCVPSPSSRVFPPRRRQLPDPHGRHGGAVHRQRGGQGATVPAQPGAGLGDGRIRHAAARHAYARRPRGGAWQAERAHAGNPAPDRPQPARRGGPQGHGRNERDAGLRRAERRWRHALRQHHRQPTWRWRWRSAPGGKARAGAVPLLGQVAAVSCGLVAGEAVLDLDYVEDSGPRRTPISC